jgi:altronate dehydratase small subunit
MPVESGKAMDDLQRGTDSRLLLLAREDNVLVAKTRIRAGETVDIGGTVVVMPADVPIGHKLAREAISAGAKIMKYGAPIGSATAAIARGELVHVHNVKSDYTPTYHLEDVRAEYGRSA